MSSHNWFDDYFDAVYSYILLQVKHEQTAEDLAQETFIKVITGEHQFKGQSSVKTWIFRIAYTTVISHFRKKHPLTHFIDLPINNSLLDLSAEKTALLNFQHKEFYDALGKLKPSYQQVITLRKVQEFSTKETAVILNCTESKVKMSLSRALTAFKQELEKGGFTIDTLVR
ncbi:RNA polymerase sigma factor [Sporosarcina sp. BI001-red]|uniref:RNA polymerase sigma factor n=1 Tax=Sporosarcina sp. BI001-red TaxID=2282866 RepID=UPI000E25F3E9|nr:RNA polymerase sigma factor [Sporosarcina sp. BI001-red]REB11639.1 RNA polymerase sigma factor [Sporosarcina sp. BI001-red]